MKNDWKKIIELEKNKPYFRSLNEEIVQQRAQENAIFPLEKDVFSAFEYVDIAEVKVVILGQDPYHGLGKQGQPQAHGLAFSVNKGIKTPPSLVNIYKELNSDVEGFVTPEHGNLIDWAEQGVLLLNTVLTVKQGQAHSHAKLGWETFTQVIIEAISQHNPGCVFMLWGSHAQKKGKKIDTDKHLVLASPHPSPLSAYRGFFGCQHFSKTNQWLIEHDLMAIDWTINP